MDLFSPLSAHSLSSNSRRETEPGDPRGRKMIILDFGEENHGLVVLKENYNISDEIPNANTDWNTTWRQGIS